LASVCPQPLLGVAAGFSAFVFGNETDGSSNATTFSVDLVNGDFESAVAVNGGLRLRGFGIFQHSAHAGMVGPHRAEVDRHIAHLQPHQLVSHQMK
jgi:hypothetical protein